MAGTIHQECYIALAVIVVADYAGEGEKEDTDCDDVFSNRTDMPSEGNLSKFYTVGSAVI